MLFFIKCISWLALAAVLVYVSISDIKTGELPTEMLIVLSAICAASTAFGFINPFRESLIACFAAAIIFSAFAFLKLIGAGDVIIICAGALLLGRGIFAAIVVASITATVYFIIKKQRLLPFAPFLSVGILTAVFFGNFLTDLYLRLLL